MNITVYSGENCPRCQRVKVMLELAGHVVADVSAAMMAEVHEGWRDDGSTDLLAWRTLQPDDVGNQLPILKVADRFFGFKDAEEWALLEVCLAASRLQAIPYDIQQMAVLREVMRKLVRLPYRIDLHRIDAVVRADGKCPCCVDRAKAPTCPCPSHKADIEREESCGCELLHQQE